MGEDDERKLAGSVLGIVEVGGHLSIRAVSLKWIEPRGIDEDGGSLGDGVFTCGRKPVVIREHKCGYEGEEHNEN